MSWKFWDAQTSITVTTDMFKMSNGENVSSIFYIQRMQTKRGSLSYLTLTQHSRDFPYHTANRENTLDGNIEEGPPPSL